MVYNLIKHVLFSFNKKKCFRLPLNFLSKGFPSGLNYQPVFGKMSPLSSVNLLKQVFKQWNTHWEKKKTLGITKKLISIIKEQNLQTSVLCPMYLHVQKWTSVKLDLFRCLAHDGKSQEKGNIADVFGQRSWFRKSARQTAWLRGTHWECSSKPLKHSIVERILVFKW